MTLWSDAGPAPPAARCSVPPASGATRWSATRWVAFKLSKGEGVKQPSAGDHLPALQPSTRAAMCKGSHQPPSDAAGPATTSPVCTRSPICSAGSAALPLPPGVSPSFDPVQLLSASPLSVQCIPKTCLDYDRGCQQCDLASPLACTACKRSHVLDRATGQVSWAAAAHAAHKQHVVVWSCGSDAILQQAVSMQVWTPAQEIQCMSLPAAALTASRAHRSLAALVSAAPSRSVCGCTRAEAALLLQGWLAPLDALR